MADTLPANCEVCAFAEHATKLHCTRHAPAPGREDFEIVYWPVVAPGARCGQGSARLRAEVIDYNCESCMHWFQPDGVGLKPDYRGGLSAEWWARSGYCTRLAPSPSSEEDQRISWKVTHAAQGCGDGDHVSDAP